MKERMKALLAEYGRIALGVYLTLFVVTFAGFFIAFSAGFSTDSAVGTAGTAGSAWLATKATQLLRVAATAALTPIAALVIRGRRHTEAEDAPSEE